MLASLPAKCLPERLIGNGCICGIPAILPFYVNEPQGIELGHGVDFFNLDRDQVLLRDVEQ